MIETFNELIQTNEIQSKILSTILIVLILWILRWIVVQFIGRRFRNNTRAHYSWRKIAEYSVAIVGIFLVGRLWISGLESLATYLGLVSAGIAIALQDPIVNIAAWLYIVGQRPFAVGDRIQIGDQMGDVVDIGLFEFVLLEIGGDRIDAEQSTGRILHIPNGQVFRSVLANTHQGVPFIWNELPVLITFESDWQKAKAILEHIIHENAPDVSTAIADYRRRTNQRFVINYGRTTPTVYTEVESSGVQITLRYLVAPRKRRNSEQQLWEAILHAFGRHWDIDFAYPTQREYIHFRERPKPPAPEDAPTVVARWQTPTNKENQQDIDDGIIEG